MAQQLQQHSPGMTHLTVVPPPLHQRASGVAPARRPAVVARRAVGGALRGEEFLQLRRVAHWEEAREET